MDWIEEVWEKWRRILKSASLRKTMVIYLIMTVLIILIMIAVTWRVCDSWKTVICQVNSIGEDYRYVGDGAFVLYYRSDKVEIGRSQDILSLSKQDTRLYTVLSIIELLCIPLYSIAGIFFVSYFYYRNKLREPIKLLKTEMDYIRRNDLSFSCYYDSADEMGDICKTMDTMRISVINNQKNMWELMEEQRKVNAAFAHDLRTPLTVISGYVDMIMEYYPKGTLTGEKMMEILSSIQGQTVRMKEFSETMKEMHSFEVLEVRTKKHTGQELEHKIRTMTEGLAGEAFPTVEVAVEFEKTSFYYDENIVLEVLGNLLSNALRYGKEKIVVLVEQKGDKLTIYVKDDGRGLTQEELYKADSPYYSDKRKPEGGNGQTHFGLGLTICKILCKKHGGGISFANSVEGGAIVSAEFMI